MAGGDVYDLDLACIKFDRIEQYGDLLLRIDIFLAELVVFLGSTGFDLAFCRQGHGVVLQTRDLSEMVFSDLVVVGWLGIVVKGVHA